MDLQAEHRKIERVVAPRTRRLWWGAVLIPVINGLLLVLVLSVVPGAARDAVGALDPVPATVTGIALAADQPRRTARLGPAWDVQVAWLDSGSGRTATAKARGADQPYQPGEHVTIFPAGSTAYFEGGSPGLSVWALAVLLVISLGISALLWRQRRRWEQLVRRVLAGAEPVPVEITRVENNVHRVTRRCVVDYRPVGSGGGGFFSVDRTPPEPLPNVGEVFQVWTGSDGRAPFLIRDGGAGWRVGRARIQSRLSADSPGEE